VKQVYSARKLRGERRSAKKRKCKRTSREVDGQDKNGACAEGRVN